MGLNVAIVGLGGIGNTHAGIYHEHADCTIVAVVDAIAEKLEEGAEKYDCPAFPSVADMVASDIRVDVASVCTAGVENGGDHYEPTIALLDAGISVLGEKPISNEIPKAREMVSLAREKNLRYGINLNHRFTPAALRAKEWVEAGRLGDLNIINMTMWINNPNESSPHFHMRALHPHSIDVMRYFCGDVEKVQAFFKKGTGRKIWSNVQVNMLFANGIIGHLTGSYDAGGSYGLETCEVVGLRRPFCDSGGLSESRVLPALLARNGEVRLPRRHDGFPGDVRKSHHSLDRAERRAGRTRRDRRQGGGRLAGAAHHRGGHRVVGHRQCCHCEILK